MKIIRSPKSGKKWRAVFKDGTHTDFGAEGMMDYTLYYKENKELAEKRKKAYQARHKKDLETGDPKRAGFLSFYLLWTEPTLERALQAYQRKYPDL